MARGHSGFISIYENGSWGGGTPYDPQALVVEVDQIGFGKDIKTRPDTVFSGRTYTKDILVDGPEKPEGQLAFELHSDDSLKLLYSHFQHGSTSETGTGTPFTYMFYPSKGNPSYSNNGGFGEGAYGTGTGYVYSVSVLRKYFNTDQHGGTNSVLFKNGIANRVGIQVGAEEDARLVASLKFRDFVSGTAISALPGTEVGTYSPSGKYAFWAGTVTVDGVSVDVDSLTLDMDNGLEERSRIGRKNPETFAFGRHKVTGELTLDMPRDGLKTIGSMLALKEFSIAGTLYNSASDQMTFTLPCCVRQPFDVGNNQNEKYRFSIPFEAFEKNGTPSVRVHVVTNYEFNGLETLWDAGSTSRTLADYEDLDAGSTSRILSEYEIADRDA